MTHTMQTTWPNESHTTISNLIFHSLQFHGADITPLCTMTSLDTLSATFFLNSNTHPASTVYPRMELSCLSWQRDQLHVENSLLPVWGLMAPGGTQAGRQNSAHLLYYLKFYYSFITNKQTIIFPGRKCHLSNPYLSFIPNLIASVHFPLGGSDYHANRLCYHLHNTYGQLIDDRSNTTQDHVPSNCLDYHVNRLCYYHLHNTYGQLIDDRSNATQDHVLSNCPDYHVNRLCYYHLHNTYGQLIDNRSNTTQDHVPSNCPDYRVNRLCYYHLDNTYGQVIDDRSNTTQNHVLSSCLDYHVNRLCYYHLHNTYGQLIDDRSNTMQDYVPSSWLFVPFLPTLSSIWGTRCNCNLIPETIRSTPRASDTCTIHNMGDPGN